MKGIHAGAVHKELQLVGKTHTGEVHEGLSPMGRTSCRNRERTPLPEEEAVTETCDELSVTSIPHLTALLGERG